MLKTNRTLLPAMALSWLMASSWASPAAPLPHSLSECPEVDHPILLDLSLPDPDAPLPPVLLSQDTIPALVPATAPLTPVIPPLKTDRPDFTEASVVVPKGSIQLESGWTFEHGGDGSRAFIAPEALFRIGVAERLELRVVTPNFLQLRGPSNATGFGDLQLGSKIQFGPLPGGFDASLITGVNFPTGNDALSRGRIDPELKLTWARDINNKWETGGIVGFFWRSLGNADQRQFAWQPVVEITYSFTDRLSIFTEYVAEFRNGGDDIHFLHQGFAFLVTPLQQLDIHYGVGFTPASPDYFIAAGYTIRVDHVLQKLRR